MYKTVNVKRLVHAGLDDAEPDEPGAVAGECLRAPAHARPEQRNECDATAQSVVESRMVWRCQTLCIYTYSDTGLQSTRGEASPLRYERLG